ncbi:alkaline phosphatase family protein [Acetobacteroides hydrogenigenes]|uniref:Type I phosphodiesterase/nucleotide pyrophosphatase n=1 Tax=Acetobacteroides hydrogenigenes TaxID=979970 RepID=A0A4R2ESC8_9BACT|nr:alkaline phosphatase family protein [Acetobacteroides hydrogenigenes]TCN72138.1 type I phosphodiesterase/nucleotide pyrophosphatase [Acetobacteroides hydrogenigenes]
MSLYILGIDGLDLDIIDHYIEQLPNFKKIRDAGYLQTIETVFPADSVPAWSTIFTGLNPAEHGIIRGKDYVESVEQFKKNNKIDITGKTFWDDLSKNGKRCLVLNPFLAYPSWPINGIMISGPAFVEGIVSKHPSNTITYKDHVYGGYKALGNVSNLKNDMDIAFQDIKDLWHETKFHLDKEKYDLIFVTFTTLDRIQHYTWRFFDKKDPLHEYENFLSNLILKSLKEFDKIIEEIIFKLNENDKLLIISDHGFGQRPYDLINLNELLRREGLLIVNNSASSGLYWIKLKQKARNYTIKLLSKMRILDFVASKAKKIPGAMKYKKSDHLIDKVNSICYVDELFCGKKPYIGLNFGSKIKGNKQLEEELFNRIIHILDNCVEFPKYKWVKRNFELYNGMHYDRLPDICIELPMNYGIEYDLFGDILTTSSTHYKISGGHYSSGTLGIFPHHSGNRIINKVEDFKTYIQSLI